MTAKLKTCFDTEVSAKNHMLCWNENGEVDLVPWPDVRDVSARFPYTALACNADVRQMDTLPRMFHTMTKSIELMICYGISPSEVHNTMSKLLEYKLAFKMGMDTISERVQ